MRKQPWLPKEHLEAHNLLKAFPGPSRRRTPALRSQIFRPGLTSPRSGGVGQSWLGGGDSELCGLFTQQPHGGSLAPPTWARRPSVSSRVTLPWTIGRGRIATAAAAAGRSQFWGGGWGPARVQLPESARAGRSPTGEMGSGKIRPLPCRGSSSPPTALVALLVPSSLPGLQCGHYQV